MRISDWSSDVCSSDLAGPERRHQNLLDIGQEGAAMHGAVEHHRRGHAAGPQSDDEGRGLPVAMRHRSPAALDAWRAAADAGPLCRRPGPDDEQPAIPIQLRSEVKPGTPAHRAVTQRLLTG